MRPNASMRPRHCAGFTLVEAIIVIVITGILAGTVAVFIKGAVDAYIDSARRAELTDVADTAVRRIARDIHLALPNSVRNPDNDSDQCVEFMPTKIGARYRMAKDSSGNGDELDFYSSVPLDNSFDMLWLNSALPATMQIAAGDVVVVYNDGSGNSDCSGSVGSGTAGGNAYCGYNAIQVGSVVPEDATAKTTRITFDASAAAPFDKKQLPGESPYYRFQVIPKDEHVVAYVCSAGTPKTLYRYSRTLSAPSWPVPATCAAMAAGATAAILAENVDSCSLKYEPPGSSTGFSMNGILQISLTVTQSGESVRLYHQVHVDNTP